MASTSRTRSTRRVKSLKPKGVGARQAKRLKGGIEIDETTWKQIVETAKIVGVRAQET